MTTASYLRRLPAIAAAAVFILAGAAPAFAQQNREEIEKIVREYILKNPEILEEAIEELRNKREKQAQSQRVSALQSHKKEIYDSPRDVIIGNPKGNVTLVEFFDYNCGYCRRSFGDITALIKSDPNLKIVLKELPILSKGSGEAARVSVAVRMQDPSKFMAFHTALMNAKGEVNGEQALAAAKIAGFNMERINKDMNSPEATATLNEVVTLAKALAINGTPAFVLGDEVIPGAIPGAQLAEAIAQVRKCGKLEC